MTDTDKTGNIANKEYTGEPIESLLQSGQSGSAGAEQAESMAGAGSSAGMAGAESADGMAGAGSAAIMAGAAEPDAEEMKALALAYARYLAEHGIEPGGAEEEALAANAAKAAGTAEEETSGSEHEEHDAADEIQVTAAAEPGESQEEQSTAAAEPEESQEEQGNAAAEPGESQEEQGIAAAESSESQEEQSSAAAGAEGSRNKRARRKIVLSLHTADQEISDEVIRKNAESLAADRDRYSKLAAPVNLMDRAQDGISETMAGLGRDLILAGHSITSTYRQSRKVIGMALLAIGITAAVLLAVLDRFTLYEYAYNGKVLGYVRNQEDVTDVLDIAGTMLSENTSGDAEISFVANQNVTFNPVDSRGRSVDDADTAVNKLVYMTDIETEAYGIYDGDKLKAIAKSSEDAEELLEDARRAMSQPDDGMEVVSSEYINETSVRPLNVLLTSIQSNKAALRMMTKGGSMRVYHIVEEGENILTIAKTYGVEPVDVYTENNKDIAVDIEKGDTVCIHEEIEPVQVKMVEEGRMKEILEFETIKKESEDYYKGDTHTEQEGVNGVQIFQGSITKISGEITSRDPENIEVITKKQDKIILVGTAERPKTAATGTYIVPLEHYEGITSPFGYRWGRLHSGIDMGAHHGEPIHATDGGTVQRAGWYYGYGLCVEIDHGNGRMTRYGHCSALLVNLGDKVYQGQTIALVGNTGHSFGNHLHFEVNFNGSPVDPRPYLGI